MRILPSSIEGIVLTAAGNDLSLDPFPDTAVVLPPGFPAKAIEYSVTVHNRTVLPIAFLGVRFNLLKRSGKPAESLHYADSLRYPEHAALVPRSARFVSIEHGVTEAVLRGIPLHEMPSYQRILMNLDNVSAFLSVTACLDCVAFSDGRFFGPDAGRAFSRLAADRETEDRYLQYLLSLAESPDDLLRTALARSASSQQLRRFARLVSVFEQEGRDAVNGLLRAFRLKIPLVRG